jgi:dTDP-4-amino-4,6-dideoxygalactose transaminase
MNIPLVDLKAQFESIESQVLDEFKSILDNMSLFLGPNVQEFEKKFAQYLGVAHARGVGSGTEALELALRAAEVGAGDEVITVSHTFFATVEAICSVGARPVFVDIDPETCLMQVDSIEQVVTSRTKAIIPVHLYGQMVDMDSVMSIARQHDLKVIEDACQAHGAEQHGRKAGSIGDVGCFSFYCSKNLGSYGEAGAVVTESDEIAGKLELLRNHGQKTKYEHVLMGFNSRIDEFQAAVLRIKLPLLDGWNRRRRELAGYYTELLNDQDITCPSIQPGNTHVFHLYVIQTRSRDRLFDKLRNAGVGCGIHYKIPCHLQPPLLEMGCRKGDLPVTEAVCDRVISLPVYPEMNETQVEYIRDRIAELTK